MPQDMTPLPFQKSTEWIKKWLELIKKTKKEQMEESGGLIQWADGSWCQFELFWSTELKLELQPSPKHITSDPYDRHNTDTLFSPASSAGLCLDKIYFFLYAALHFKNSAPLGQTLCITLYTNATDIEPKQLVRRGYPIIDYNPAA